MTALRPFHPTDLFKTNLTNLDTLTENYELRFYLEYLAKWPSLFNLVEGQNGEIAAYIMGKVEEQPPYLRHTPEYTPWHGHITALTVAPQYRRLGLAKLLTESLERASNEQNAWFVDLYVRESNKVAGGLYRGMGYSVFRRVVDYYSDNMTGEKDTEDAFDMRKPLDRDKDLRWVRQNGEEHRVGPEDVF